MSVLRGKTNLEQFLERSNSPLAMDNGPNYTTIVMQDRARPRQETATPSPAATQQFIDTAADTLARQRIANKRAADLATERTRIKDILENDPPDPAKVKKPRAKKTRRHAPASDTPKSAKDWLEQAAREVTNRRIKNGETLDYTAAYNTTLYELKDGFFNPLYWVEAELLSTDYLQNVPTSGPDPKQRSYAYPDPANVRTLATYGNGSAGSGPSRYSGNSAGGQFVDTLLVWKRHTFKYKKGFMPADIEPIFIEINGSITAFADQRGSAPMLSYISKTWNVKVNSSRLTTATPPTDKPWSFYWRYKVPDTAPPFYQTIQVRKAIRTMRQPKHEESDGKLEKAVVLIAPRPMYGRGFNNNTGITTQFDPTVKLWQIKPPLRLRLLIGAGDAGAILWDGTDYTVKKDYSAYGGSNYAPRAIAAGPNSICTADTNNAEFKFFNRQWEPTVTVDRYPWLPSACEFLAGVYWTACTPAWPAVANDNPDTAWSCHLYDEQGQFVTAVQTGIFGHKTITFANETLWMVGRPQFGQSQLVIEQWDATFTRLNHWTVSASGTLDYFGIAADDTHVYLTMGQYVNVSNHFIRKYTHAGQFIGGSFEIPPNDALDGDWMTALMGLAFFDGALWAVDMRDSGNEFAQLVKYNPDLSIAEVFPSAIQWQTRWYNATLDRYGE